MNKYILLLRGINVSGQKMMKMELLRKLLEDLNFSAVKTYIQSGNAVFSAEGQTIPQLEESIAKAITATFAFTVPVMIKDLAEWKAAAENNPFINDRNEDVKSLHLTFLSAIPEEERLLKLKEGNYGVDEYVIIDKAIYLYCPNGYGNTKLNNNFFESKLKVTATTRNWNTVNELLKMTE